MDGALAVLSSRAWLASRRCSRRGFTNHGRDDRAHGHGLRGHARRLALRPQRQRPGFTVTESAFSPHRSRLTAGRRHVQRMQQLAGCLRRSCRRTRTACVRHQKARALISQFDISESCPVGHCLSVTGHQPRGQPCAIRTLIDGHTIHDSPENLEVLTLGHVPLFHSFPINASITGTNPSPNKRGLHCLSVSLTDRMDVA
jgi:hypothetical protein